MYIETSNTLTKMYITWQAWFRRVSKFTPGKQNHFIMGRPNWLLYTFKRYIRAQWGIFFLISQIDRTLTSWRRKTDLIALIKGLKCGEELNLLKIKMMQIREKFRILFIYFLGAGFNYLGAAFYIIFPAALRIVTLT